MGYVYNIFKGAQLLGTNLATVDVKAMLLGTSFVFDPTNQYVSDIVSAEVSGAAYVRQSLTNTSVSISEITNQAMFFANNLTWPFLSVGSVAACVIYISGSSDSNSTLIGAFPAIPPIVTVGTALFSVKWSGFGIISVS